MYKNIFTREYSVQYTEASLRCLSTLYSQTYAPVNGLEACYVDANEWQTFLNNLEKYFATPKDTETFIAAFHNAGKGYESVAKESARDAQNSSDQELTGAYKKYISELNIYSAYLWLGYFLSATVAEKGRAILEKKNIASEDKDKIIAGLLQPIERSGILQLHDQLEAKKQTGASLSEQEKNQLVKDFAWMSCLDVIYNPWTIEDIFAFYNSLAVKEKPMRVAEAEDKAELTEAEKEYFLTVRTFAYIQDMRDVYRRRGVYAVLPLFDEIAKRCGTSRKNLGYYSNAEIISGLENDTKVSTDEIARRQRGFLIYWKDKGIVVTSEPEAVKQFCVAHGIGQKKEIATLLTGIVASRGIATGPAKIVFKIDDLQKIQPDDILVAVSTHPDFVPAMQKAAAIVTDEGGLTSHAAIVARELKKPCIVGVGTATKMLRDGDHIEVDANVGTIKLVEQFIS